MDNDKEPLAAFDKLSGKDTELVAVYGTLKRGEHNSQRYMNGAIFVGDGRTSMRYPMYIAGIPYVYDIPGEGGNIVVEVYRVSQDDLTGKLDRLEGHPSFYCRKKTQVVLHKNVVVTAWLYFMNGTPPQNARSYVNYSYNGSY